MEIIEFQLSDSPDVAIFMNKHFGTSPGTANRRRIDPDHFSWKYGPNCFGQAIGFICRQNRKVVGLYGAVRKNIHIHGEEILAFEVVNSFVAPECQGKGVFSALAEATYGEIDKVSSFVYGASPTPKSSIIHQKKGSFYEAFACKNLVLILNFRHGFSSLGLPSPVSTVMGPPADALMGMFLLAKNKGARVLDDVREIDVFPADYDTSCEQIWGGYDFALTKRRDYLEWRYAACPEPYRFCECRLKNGEAGYFIWKPAIWQDSSVGYIIDILADLRNPDMRSGIVAGMIDMMKRKGIDIVSVDLHRESPLYGDLVGCGFFPRSEPLPFIVRQTRHKFLIPGAPDFDPRNWLLLPGDGDNI